MCRTKQAYSLSAPSPEALDQFRLKYAAQKGSYNISSAESREIKMQAQNGWCCAMGDTDGLYHAPGKWSEGRFVNEYHLHWAGSVLAVGKRVFIPTVEFPKQSQNGITLLERGLGREYGEKFVSFEGTPAPGAVLFGKYVIVPLLFGKVYRFAVVNVRNAKMVGYLPTEGERDLELEGSLPWLVADAQDCLLFVADESRMYGFRYTGSQCHVPFRADGALGTTYLNGSGKLADIVFKDGKFFFSLFCKYDKKTKWKISSAEIVPTDNSNRLSVRTFPLYAGQSILRMFLYGDTLYWFELSEGDLLLHACRAVTSKDGLADTVIGGEVLAAPCRFINRVDLVEYDGSVLKVYGHIRQDSRYARCVCAKLEGGVLGKVSGEMEIAERPYLFRRVGEEQIACPRHISVKDVSVFVDGDTIVKIK